MEKVDRLIIKAKKAALSKAERFTTGLVYPDGGKWIAQGNLWTDARGGVRQIITEHDTMEAAANALQVLADEYPNPVKDALILIDDIDDGS